VGSIRPLKNKLYSDEKTILFVLAIFFSCSLMKADPAKKVNVTYQDGKLKVEALHKVRNASNHFIDQVVVKVNGKEMKTIRLDKQTSTASQLVEIELPDLKKGDQIEVVTRCNEFGKKNGKLIL
jgi:hypothetical protein